MCVNWYKNTKLYVVLHSTYLEVSRNKMEESLREKKGNKSSRSMASNDWV